MSRLLCIARKEFGSFFSSPLAFIFLGTYLVLTLFVFFWVETFFSRNIADVRPLFEWMPVLLIFLSAAITMRMWAEERRTGTLEFLLSSPVHPVQLVLGKFLACLGLIVLALALTLPLPITINYLAPLDWGPVIGGYLATLFLAAAYIAIGLFVSARSENQIISLIVTALLCGIFYALGSSLLAGLFGTRIMEIFQLLGSGTRFESITRGVLDLRDLYYYLSLAGVFLTLNVFALERRRWAGNPSNIHHWKWGALTVLLTANFLAANLWMAQIGWARADMTKGNVYSISPATKGYLSQLREPLLIRGYFGAKTHPLLAPLVPRLRDLMQEYSLAGGDRVIVEFVDPMGDPEMEEEARLKYGIQPKPFQFASKYESAVVSSYFDILVKYGDQHEVLGLGDLIEAKQQGESDMDIELRNPEYELTRSVKKVLQAYRGADRIFESIDHPIAFTGYVTPDDRLPEPLPAIKLDLLAILQDLQAESNGKLSFEFVDPDADGGAVAQKLRTEFGFRPMSMGQAPQEPFWFYMTLEGDGRIVQIPLPSDRGPGPLLLSIQGALKRFAQGFLKNVALYAPSPQPPGPGQQPTGMNFQWLRGTLSQDSTVSSINLRNTGIPDKTDLLMVVAPKRFTDEQVFAMDQFLMRGGTVVLASSPFDVEVRGGIRADEHASGLTEWLAHHGVAMDRSLVLDDKNIPLAIPVNRQVGEMVFRETRLIEYPYFADIRSKGMDQDSGIMAGMDQVVMTWASPLHIDAEKNSGRKVIRLLQSSDGTRTTNSTRIEPRIGRDGEVDLPPGSASGQQLLGVVLEGRFESFFKSGPTPSAARDTSTENMAAGAEQGRIEKMIEHSPEGARIVLLSSTTFLSDEALSMISSSMGTRYQSPVQLMKNIVDWSLEDRELLAIRGRTHFARTLPPMEHEARMLWEGLNYGLALLGLALVWVFRKWSNARQQARHLKIMNPGGVEA